MTTEQTVEGPQEMFCCAALADDTITDAGKVRWLHITAHDYWNRLELAESERKDAEKESFERVTALRLALRDALDLTEALGAMFTMDGNDLEPLRLTLEKALEQDGAA